MSIKLTKLSSILLIAATSSLFTLQVKAEEPAPPVSVEEAFENAYFDNAGNSYQKSGFLGQLNTILGFQGFPDRQISADGKSVDRVYHNALESQSQVGSPILTRDLNNPYNSSLIENPSYIGY